MQPQTTPGQDRPHNQKPQAQPCSRYSQGQCRDTAMTLALLQPAPAPKWPTAGPAPEPAQCVPLSHSLEQLPQVTCIGAFLPSCLIPQPSPKLPRSERSPGLILPCQPLLVPRWGRAPHLGSSSRASVPRAAPAGAVSQAEPLGQSPVLFPAWRQSLLSKRRQFCVWEDKAFAPAGAPNAHHRSLQAAKGSGGSRPCF